KGANENDTQGGIDMHKALDRLTSNSKSQDSDKNSKVSTSESSDDYGEGEDADDDPDRIVATAMTIFQRGKKKKLRTWEMLRHTLVVSRDEATDRSRGAAVDARASIPVAAGVSSLNALGQNSPRTTVFSRASSKLSTITYS
ncbi:unnamed protein product, partial [Amoebophrya sp. A25]